MSSNESAIALKCLGDVKTYCVVQLKCVGVILLSYRRDKQMRLGSRAPIALLACCETKQIFETSAAGDAAGQANIVTPCKQMIEIPSKTDPHDREQPKTQMHSHLVRKF